MIEHFTHPELVPTRKGDNILIHDKLLLSKLDSGRRSDFSGRIQWLMYSENQCPGADPWGQKSRTNTLAVDFQGWVGH